MCDFGLSRALPTKSAEEKEVQSVQNHLYTEYATSTPKTSKDR